MKKYKLIVGIDVSKSTLDVCFLIDPFSPILNYLKVSNNLKGIRKILIACKKLGVWFPEILFCFENTGMYSMSLCFALSEQKLDFWMIPALEIKRAKGISRGKTDRIDSRDIAFYGITHIHKLQLYRLPEKELLKLQLLYSEREKLVKAIMQFERSHEVKGLLPKEITNEMLKLNQRTIKKLKQFLKEIEQKIINLIKENQELKTQFDLICSVPGVGPQTAIYLLIKTKCFTAFKNWRKAACYAGIAPFEYSSGSSIKGKTKVHHLADKKMKTLLHMCALNAKRYDHEIREYYLRKIATGKNPMLVMNAIRCKVLSRIFATVNRGTPFVDLKKFAA